MDWFREITTAIQFNRWEHLRGILSLAVSQQDTQVVIRNDEETQKQQKSFWRRIANSVVGDEEAAANPGNSKLQHMKGGLLKQQKGTGRTALNFCLNHPEKTPTDIVLYLIRLEPRAAAIPEQASSGGRFPLHTAVMNQMHLEVIAGLVEAYPAGISELDAQQQSPLSYACERAKADTNLPDAPRNFWMAQKELPPPPTESADAVVEPSADEDDSVRAANQWQEEQVDRWSIVHWLLLASATHPQTSLTVGGKRPMLVESLVFAAPPAVISLLIGASVGYLTFEKRATAFAGTTLYTCIYRHYPLTILVSLCLQCPRDVRLVQDETGMGLVAAQFVAGFFRKLSAVTEEWVLVTDFVEQAAHLLQQGSLPPQDDHPGFWDWWKKMEFLIAFGTGQKLSADKNYPSQYLLHAALSNSDVPPLVSRLLLALYPDSMALTTPAPSDMEGSLPIHLACVTPDYIPRNYELQLEGSYVCSNLSSSSLSTTEIVTHADPSCVHHRYKGRLPLHLAIAAGKLGSLQPLVNAAPETLCCRDPETHLVPFLHVAAVGAGLEQEAEGALFGPNGKYNAHSRWAFSARNKYTHHVWRGLSDRQRSNAVQKQYFVSEVLERTSTVFQLLRWAPSVVEAAAGPKASHKKKGPIREARDDSGMGTVAQHYLNYLFHKAGSDGAHREPVEEHIRNLEAAIDLAPKGDWSSLSPEFERWWNKMRFWIKYCCPKPSPRLLSHSNSIVSTFLPTSNEQYTLHMAVLNPDTPPAVVELILAVSVASASLPIPGTHVLPLHLAVQTCPYIPRHYEANLRSQQSLISLLVDAYSQAVSETTDEGKVPLHLAIQAGRVHWEDELEPLVQPDPGVLRRRDPTTNLYPFQLMAVKREFTREDRVRFLFMARNEGSLADWNKLSPFEQTNAVYQHQKNHDRNVLSSIFELLRADVTMIQPARQETASYVATERSRVFPNAAAEEEEEATETSATTERRGAHSYLADHDHTDTSKSLTEADTIYSSSNNAHSPTPPLASPIRHLLDPNAGNTRQIQGYIPAVLGSPRRKQTRPVDASVNSEATPLPDLDSIAISNAGIPDLDSGGHGSEMLELESQGSNRSSRSGLERTPSEATLSSQGSRVQDGPEKTTLMSLLSQHETRTAAVGDVYECDASILSNLDVMSTLSSTLHNVTAHSMVNVTAHSMAAGNNTLLAAESFDEEEGNDDSVSVTEGGESSAYEFACESDIGDASCTFAGDESSAALSLPVPSDLLRAVDHENESDSEDSEYGGLVTFEYRRRSRDSFEERETSFARLPVSIRASGQIAEMSTATGTTQQTKGRAAPKRTKSVASSQSSDTFKRGSVTSLRSHLSDLTTSHKGGESKHTFKSFATEGSTKTIKSFATSDRSFATYEEKSFATGSLSGASQASPKEAKSERNPDYGRTENERYGVKGKISDIAEDELVQKKSEGNGNNLYSSSHGRSEPAHSNSVRSGDNSYRSMTLPFDMIDAGAVGMVWLGDDTDLKETRNKNKTSITEGNRGYGLLETTLDESKEMILFADSDHSKHSVSQRSSKSVSFRALGTNNLVSCDDGSESSSVMEFVADSRRPKSVLADGDNSDESSVEEDILIEIEGKDEAVINKAEGDKNGREVEQKENIWNEKSSTAALEPEKRGPALSKDTHGHSLGKPNGTKIELPKGDKRETQPGLLAESSNAEDRLNKGRELTRGHSVKELVNLFDKQPESPNVNTKPERVQSVGNTKPESSYVIARDDDLGHETTTEDFSHKNHDHGLCTDAVQISTKNPHVQAKPLKDSSVDPESTNESVDSAVSADGHPSDGDSNSLDSMSECSGGFQATASIPAPERDGPIPDTAEPKSSLPVSNAGHTNGTHHDKNPIASKGKGAETSRTVVSEKDHNPLVVSSESLSVAQSDTIDELSTCSSHRSSSVAEMPRRKDDHVAQFDRLTMRWVQKQPGPQSVSESSTLSTGPKKRMTFDRVAFRWKEVVDEAGEHEEEDSIASSVSSTPDAKGKAQQRKRKQPSIKLNLGTKSPSLNKPLGSIPEQQSGKDKDAAAANDFLCLICEQNPRAVVMKPCFHLSICADCSSKFDQIDTCPLCQNEVTGRIQLTK